MPALDRHHELPFWSGAIPTEAPQRPAFGLLLIWCVPLLSGMLPLLDVRVGQLTTRGFLWVLMLLAAGFVYLLEKAVNPQTRSRLPCAPWLVFLSFLWLSLLWVESLQRRNIQVATQLSLPLLMGVLSSMFVTEEHQLKVLLRLFAVGLLLALFSKVIGSFGLLASEQAGVRSQAINIALFACVFLGSSPPRHVYALVGWFVCLAVAASSGSRLATLAILIVPLVHPLYRGRWLLRSVLFMAALAIGTWIFNTPMFQARFFYRGSGTLADVLRGDFDTSGRFEAWPVLWEEAFKRPLLGSGVGSSMVFLESGQSGLTMTHPHNDYLRIAFEVGFIGLACFVVVLVWQVFELSRRIRNSSGLVRNTFAMALMGWFVFAIMALTDNIIIYTVHYMVPLFALMGAAYGVAQNSSEPTASQAE